MTRHATIPADGTFTAFQTPEHRFAVGLAETQHSIAYAGPPTLTVMIGDPSGHPFDGSPLSLLDPERVARLRDALTEWLERA